MTTRTSTYPLRLPVSLKDALERLAKADGTSMNQFIVCAVAEKISALATADVFAERRARADRDLFLRILNREGGLPQPGDEIPEDLVERPKADQAARG